MRLKTIKRDPSQIDSDKYWDLVRRTLGDIFQKSPGDVKSLENRVRSSPPDEQVLFYHLEPLSTAAELAGTNPTQEEIERYKILRANIYNIP